ncbi:MAG: hypothetical protein JXR53_15275 [Bacteroidales bacterium]|nr:hypothetical protein [Bacteroidales bacterium]
MSKETISPWDGAVSLESPDGKFQAEIKDTIEIAMGAPTSGTLRLSDGRQWESCNVSMIWSTDSRYLAVPQWTRNRNQRLMIIDVIEHHTFHAKGEFRVLQLEKFQDGIIEGIDSPIHMPKQVRIELNEILK